MIVLTSSSAGRQTPESEQRHIERPLFLFRQQNLFHAHYACQHPEYGGCAPDYYLVYLGKQTPSSWEFKLPKPPQDKGQPPAEGMEFTVDVLDTWNMTVAPVAGVFTLKKRDGYFYTDQGGRHFRIRIPTGENGVARTRGLNHKIFDFSRLRGGELGKEDKSGRNHHGEVSPESHKSF